MAGPGRILRRSVADADGAAAGGIPIFWGCAWGCIRRSLSKPSRSLRVQIASTLPLLLFLAFPPIFAGDERGQTGSLSPWSAPCHPTRAGRRGPTGLASASPAMGVVGSVVHGGDLALNTAAVLIGYALVADLRDPSGLIRVSACALARRRSAGWSRGPAGGDPRDARGGVFAVATALADARPGGPGGLLCRAGYL